MLFQQAIYQSPDQGASIIPSDATFNTRFHDFLKTLKVNNLEEARALSTDAVYMANKATIMDYPGGQFETHSFSIDGSYVLGNIQECLNAGRYDRSVKTMTSYNADEVPPFPSNHIPHHPLTRSHGALFTLTLDVAPIPPTLDNFSFPGYVKFVLPSASPSTVTHITNDLYPLSAYAGDENARADTFTADVFVVCNAYALQSAYRNQAQAYEFSVPPAWHAQDTTYTLFDGHHPEGLFLDPRVAVDMQTYFTNFAMHGNPNQKGLAAMPVFGGQGKMLNLTEEGYKIVSEPGRMERCKFWETYEG